jgi:2,5-diketo-D-gluconate reductase A
MQTVTLNKGSRCRSLGTDAEPWVRRLPDPGQGGREGRQPTLSKLTTLLDTAAAYQNEEAVGRAVASSGIPREEL